MTRRPADLADRGRGGQRVVAGAEHQGDRGVRPALGHQRRAGQVVAEQGGTGLAGRAVLDLADAGQLRTARRSGVPVLKPRALSRAVTWVASWSRPAPLSTVTVTVAGLGQRDRLPAGRAGARLHRASVRRRWSPPSGRCSTRHQTIAVSTVSASRKASAGSGRRAVEADIPRGYPPDLACSAEAVSLTGTDSGMVRRARSLEGRRDAILFRRQRERGANRAADLAGFHGPASRPLTLCT